MSQDHSHDPSDISARLSRRDEASYLKDTVYGGIDGAVTTMAIVAGVVGAGLPHAVILALGAANILADGFSMAAGNFAGTRAERDDRDRIIETERRHIVQFRAGELEELRQLLALRGLSGTVLEEATEQVSQDEDAWVRIMLTDEYGLALTEPRPLRAATATFIAFLLAGMVPLLPFVLGLQNAFTLSAIATALTFAVIGAMKSRWSLAPWWKSSLETLLIGGTAATIAFAVGTLFSGA